MSLPDHFWIVVGPEQRPGEVCVGWPKLIVFESNPMTEDEARSRAASLAKIYGWASIFRVDAKDNRGLYAAS